MSVYKRKGETTYSYDFQRFNQRFTGTTGCTNERDAERYEAALKRDVKPTVKPKDNGLTVEAACVRFYHEVGQFHAAPMTTLTDLQTLSKRLGPKLKLDMITASDIARLVAKRRGDGVANGTVNRGTVKLARHLLTRARDAWGIETQPIKWALHILKEPQERVRELSQDEEKALFSQIREDMAPIIEFALETGCRRAECLGLRWPDIDWHGRSFKVTGKGNKSRSIPMTASVEDILRSLPRVDPDNYVFTYVEQRTGERKRIQPEGLKIYFVRAVKRAEIENFHFHDLRHTTATRLLRSGANIKTVQKLLGHESIETTTKYAHVTDDDLRNAMDAKPVVRAVKP